MQDDEVQSALASKLLLSGKKYRTNRDDIIKLVSDLWRPWLKDPQDDMVLELAVASDCQYIITYNLKDFRNISSFGIKAITPADFLKELEGQKL